MQEYCLNQYLDRIDFMSQEDEGEDEDFTYLPLEYSKLSFSMEEPELHSCPFDLDRQQSTRQKTQQRTQDLMEQEESPTQIQQKKIKNYIKTFQGSKDDTMELAINFKTLILAYFRELDHLHELKPQERAHLDEFSARPPSLESISKFYTLNPETCNIRQMCLQFWESPECIRRILKGRSRLRTKLTMIKFVERMRSNILNVGKVQKWKDRPSWKQISLPYYISKDMHQETKT